ncbi:McrB family protein [Salinirubrum litoreum]|uniref:McrB family protein n=1 Tax=Salinirubrum litoreum TaxID=1126234 RepID=A0ABD5RBL6_9EURY|nr:AAA family ATPase [Salinirubrum litoreum]
MPSTLEIEGYYFDTQELKNAYHLVPVPSTTEETDYSEAALRGVLRYFADWGPAREERLNNAAVETIETLTAAEKRSLYQTLVRRLSKNLNDQYSFSVEPADLERFFEHISADPVPESFATFLLQSVRQTSQRIHEYRQELLEEGPEETKSFFEAIRRLPGPYLTAKANQYEGDDKINGVRFRALQSIKSQSGLTIDELVTFIDEENESHEKNIAQGYTPFTTVGQLYYDYYKPRLNTYLQTLSDFFLEQSGALESTQHIVNHSEPRHKLDDFAWLAIFPATHESQTEAYQLYLGFHGDRLSYGLHVGDEKRGGEWKQQRDLERVTEEDVTAGDVLSKFESVLESYHTLNGITEPNRPERPPIADVVERQLDIAKQVVFYGPPGTSKTFEAKRFADWWVNERTEGEPTQSQVRSVTFHPSFSYEDFIEGLTADATDSGSVSYRVEDGVLKKIAENASDALRATEDGESPPPFVLIIDEINRGNLAQILGEVITLLEADKRDSFETELAHSGETFTIPSNLYVIGTMNTADQSIALVDTALRRRFRFIDFPPNMELVFGEYDTENTEPRSAVTERSDAVQPRERLLGASVLAVRTLNERILEAPQLGKGKQLGHTHLLGHDSAQELSDAWRYDILPQLEEYYFGQFDRLRDELLRETGDRLVDWDTERIRSFDVHDLYSALCDLAGIDDPVPLPRSVAAESDGGTTETVQQDAEDPWAAGERTPDTFRQRLPSTLNDESAAQIDRVLDVGEEVGWLDAGRGENNASVMVKSDDVDPGVGIIKIDQKGEIGFRWNWLHDRDENPLTREFIERAGHVFDDIDGYEHNWNPDAGDDGSFTEPTLAIDELTEEEVTALERGLRSFVEEARVFRDE